MRQRAKVLDEGTPLLLDTQPVKPGQGMPMPVAGQVPVDRLAVRPVGVRAYMDGHSTLYPWHCVLWVEEEGGG